ncbi:NAD(P)-binding protein [Calocera viscosa TUFC12733]|uniref:NAD(P)-binding protein n=1 Tax=Calocera viscosa (strain TUFC12733) TaxID=1330018 RepID=A0A167KKU6_CALVF|nr:NAD(P)-binding protein [Calocera viscosa TUFC12733]
MSKKLVVVAGATGKQGGSVVAALLNNGGYTIRGLTRNTESPASKSLAAKGVEMVQATLPDKASLVEAFKGAYAVFGVTVPHTKDSETLQGNNMVDACKANDVPLFVWSSLPSAAELSGGKVTGVSLMDDKAAVDKHIKEVGQPAVILYTGNFTENLLTRPQLIRNSSGTWEIQFPFSPADQVAITSYIEKDLGPSVVAIIDHWSDMSLREKLTEEPVIACSYNITGAEMAATITRITGKEVTYVVSEPAIIPVPARPLFKWLAENWNYPGTIPPPILTDFGVKFHSFEDFVREKVVPFMAEQE